MRLKHGKKYETADGTVYKVRYNHEYKLWDISDDTNEHWLDDGTGLYVHPDLIRRHYTKPQPAHKLDLNPGDVVELVEWEDGSTYWVGAIDPIDCFFIGEPKGQRPLFRVVSRA